MNNVLFAAVCLLGIGQSALASAAVTILTHGYSLDSTKGVWVEGMAEAIIARARDEGVASPDGGAVMRYDQDSARPGGGAWRLVSGTLDPDEPVVLIYRWLNDFDKAGPNLGFVEAAGDALLAALRDPIFVDALDQPLPPIDLIPARPAHFIGHSRGAIINSEAVRRLGAAGVSVDHVTTLDPHPVDGTLDAPWSNFDWGDPTPMRWSNIVFADNYYRADGGGFFGTEAFDFDGIPIPGALNVELSESALECCAYGFSHSDTHLWYHGTIDLSPTPCDGEECITASMRTDWWPDGFTTTGYFFAEQGGGVGSRPLPQSPLVDPGNPPVIFNGAFDGESQAGWLYHGGSISGAQIVNTGGEIFARLNAANPAIIHNRFYLVETAGNLIFDYDITTAGVGSLDIDLIDRAGATHPVATIDTSTPSTGWQRDQAALVPLGVLRGRTYRLRVTVNSASAVVGVDNIDIDRALKPCPADCAPEGGNGLVNVDDLFEVINGISTQDTGCDIAPLPGSQGGNLPLAPGGNGVVNFDDLIEVVNAFGPCP